MNSAVTRAAIIRYRVCIRPMLHPAAIRQAVAIAVAVAVAVAVALSGSVQEVALAGKYHRQV